MKNGTLGGSSSAEVEWAGEADLVDGGEGVPGKAMDLAEDVDPVRVEPFVAVCLDLSVDTGLFVVLPGCPAVLGCALGMSDEREGDDAESRDACLGTLTLFVCVKRFANEPCTGERSMGDDGDLASPPFGSVDLEATFSGIERVTKVSTSLEDITFSRFR